MRKLSFTLANLSKFSLRFSEIQSTWEPGGPLRLRLVVTDTNESDEIIEMLRNEINRERAVPCFR